MEIAELNIGIVGAGGFARFAVQAFLKAPWVKVTAVTDINKSTTGQMSEEFSLKVYDQIDQVLADKDIHLIYIATPPYLHYAQSKMALLAGKHVVCEKPAALKTSEAEELVALARSRELLYVVNLMQRYNPMFEIVRTIIQEKILGSFLHGFFENYASDENLGPGHWFWDESKSGGIFIEHGVHFFDLFEGWLGAGKVAGAWQLERGDGEDKIIDRVQATVLYNGGLVNFYHGFDQPKILDRQEMRLQFERGEITLYEWVPVKMKMHGLFKKEDFKKIESVTQAYTIVKHIDQWQSLDKAKGRFVEFLFDNHSAIEFEHSSGKQNLYQEMLTAMISDQREWIINHNHRRVIDDTNAVQSLRIAEHAKRMAKNFNY